MSDKPELSKGQRIAILATATASLFFDGVELGLMPIASLSVSKSLLGDQFSATVGGDWFARYTASLMLGAAIGGIVLGRLGDMLGRSKALGISVLFYSLFAGMGAWVTTQEQMLALRFLVGLGVGGVWPNAVALAAECSPGASRPMVAGLMGAALNLGILALSQLARFKPITPESWRWIFLLAGAPAILGLMALVKVPESPMWLAAQARSAIPTSTPSVITKSKMSFNALFTPPLLRLTLVGIMVGSIPMIGAWSASKWMIPWADKIAGVTHPGYKAITQGWWAVGAVLGSFLGAHIASRLGRRPAYAVFSIGASALTSLMFLATAPLQTSFLPIVFMQGFVATLFFGWLPLYLPELFPTHARAVGSGISYNVGRFATALGVLVAGTLFTAFDGSYPKVGATCGLIYLMGAFVIIFAPDTAHRDLKS